MTTDRELLEAAAKAAGLTITWGEKYLVGGDEVDCTDIPYIVSTDRETSPAYWNPLEDDGDALRLAVELNMVVGVMGRPHETNKFTAAYMLWNEARCDQPHGEDPAAATRRAIVTAAAALGSHQGKGEPG